MFLHFIYPEFDLLDDNRNVNKFFNTLRRTELEILRESDPNAQDGYGAKYVPEYSDNLLFEELDESRWLRRNETDIFDLYDSDRLIILRKFGVGFCEKALRDINSILTPNQVYCGQVFINYKGKTTPICLADLPTNPYERQEHVQRISDATCRSFGSIAKQGHVISVDEFDSNLREYDIYIGVKQPRQQEGFSIERRFFSPHLFNLPRITIRNKMSDCSKSLERRNSDQPAGLVVYCTKDVALNPSRKFSIHTSHDFHPIYKRDIFTFDFVKYEPGNNNRYVCRVSPFRFLYQYLNHVPYHTKMIERDNYIELKNAKSKKSCAQLCASYSLKTSKQLEGDLCRGIFIIEASKWSKSTLDQTYCANIYRGFSAPGLGVYLSFTLPGQDLYQLSAPFCYDPRLAEKKAEVYIPFTTEKGNDFCILYRRNLNFKQAEDFCQLYGMIMIPYEEISKLDTQSWRSSVLFKALFSEANEQSWSAKMFRHSTICNYFVVPEYPLGNKPNHLISLKEDSCDQKKSVICIRRMLGSWGPWGPWSECKGVGNFGEWTRSRKCNDPYPLPAVQRTGLFCEENNFDIVKFETVVCDKIELEKYRLNIRKKVDIINDTSHKLHYKKSDLDPDRLMKNIENINGYIDFVKWNRQILDFCEEKKPFISSTNVSTIQRCENECYQDNHCSIYSFDSKDNLCYRSSSFCVNVSSRLENSAYFKTSKICQLTQRRLHFPYVFDSELGYCFTYLGMRTNSEAIETCLSLKMHLVKYKIRQKMSIEYYLLKKLPLQTFRIWNGLILSDMEMYRWQNNLWNDEEAIASLYLESGAHGVLKPAQTIAQLAHIENVNPDHIAIWHQSALESQ
ncbi:DgyrCDS9750 [Dimorphilus gyrociliatus]|uniref:DgyrCDS9750 n=1 Tax=Dimorphilus gyrociliatus TaxID=2664684 RepID=A0A7I8VYA7_9ANNE|nr:DgyrCDS9750 [Dimorphilus gyrociliatus]